MESPVKTLVYGYGNPGRGDDGLGPALVEKIQAWIVENNVLGVDTDSNYQLNIEDAYNIKDYDIVIFADASCEDIEHFIIERVKPDEKTAFNTHSVSAGFVLNLCNNMYGKKPLVFLLHLRGYDFGLKEGFSDLADSTLNMAYNYLVNIIATPRLSKLLESVK
ncbi:MAG TPA: hydrogenase maturation protease [Cyclobacteriaceae bacterium]|nr:hydrogenase maturation protease [Cyclobacteriaceae bacterium]